MHHRSTHEPRSSRHRLIFSEKLDRLPSSAALWRIKEEEKDHSRLHEAMKCALTPRQYEIVLLFFFEGLSQSEIARRKGVSQQVIHRAIYGTQRRGRAVGGALRRLRDVLKHP